MFSTIKTTLAQPSQGGLMGLDPKFNRIAPPECNFIKTELSSNRIGVDPIDHILNAKPDIQICKHFHNASVIGERRILQDGHIL